MFKPECFILRNEAVVEHILTRQKVAGSLLRIIL